MSSQQQTYKYLPHLVVADGDTLLAGFTSVIDVTATATLTPPAVPPLTDGKAYFTVINTGAGVLKLTGFPDSTGVKVRSFTANADNSAWLEMTAGNYPEVVIADTAPDVLDYDRLWVQPIRVSVPDATALRVQITINQIGFANRRYGNIGYIDNVVDANEPTDASIWLPLVTIDSGTIELGVTTGAITAPLGDYTVGQVVNIEMPVVPGYLISELASRNSSFSVTSAQWVMKDSTLSPATALPELSSAFGYLCPTISTITDYDEYANIPDASGVRSWVKQVKGSATQITSPDANTYAKSENGKIDWVVDGNPVGNVVWDADLNMPKWTLSGGLDPVYYQGNPQTIAQRDALVATNGAAKSGFLVYVKDGTVNEYQWWDGSVWHSLGAGGISAKFFDDINSMLLEDTSGFADGTFAYERAGRVLYVLDKTATSGDLGANPTGFWKTSTVSGVIWGDDSSIANLDSLSPPDNVYGILTQADGTNPAGIYRAQSGSFSGGLVAAFGGGGYTEWTASMSVRPPMALFYTYSNGVTVYFVTKTGASASTANASFGITEINKYQFEGQNDLQAFLPNVAYFKGFRCLNNGTEYVCTANHAAAATFDATKWTATHSQTVGKKTVYRLTSDNATVLSGAVAAIKFETYATDVNNFNATYNGTVLTVTTGALPVRLTAQLFAIGTGAATVNYAWQRTADTLGTLLGVNANDGITSVGQTGTGSANNQAEALLAPNTTFSLQLVQTSASANNQKLQAQSFICLEEAGSAIYSLPSNTVAAELYTYTANAGANTISTNIALTMMPCLYTVTPPAGKVVSAVTVGGVNVPLLPQAANQFMYTAGAGTTAVDFTVTFANVVYTPKTWQVIGEFIPPANTVYDTLATVTTGIDFTKCTHIEAVGRKTTDDRATSSFIPVIIGNTTPTMEFQFSGGQMSCYIANATDAAAGKLTNIDCHGIAFETTAIRGWAIADSLNVVPINAQVYAPRTITGTGIAANTVGRDNTVSSIRITGITAGSEIIPGNISGSGGATVEVVESGRSGTATVDVIPNGADTVVTATQTVWRRTLTATVNGAAGTINGVASANVNATAAVDFWLTLPANHLLTGAPTVTGGILASWSADGSGVITPSNTGNITVTANSAQQGARSARLTANAGTWVTFGTLQYTMPASSTRSFQVRSAAGTLNATYHSWTGWDSTTALITKSLTPASAEYLEPGFAYGNAGNNQFFWIEDNTNGRRYEGTFTVGSSYNNNIFWIKEVT